MATARKGAGSEHQTVEVRTADGVFSIGPGQRITTWSPSAQAILGHTADQVEGRPCYEVICGQDGRGGRVCVQDCFVMANARRGRVTADYDVLSRRADGSPVWLNISVVQMGRAPGRPAQLLHLFRDVTEKRRLEEKAEQALGAIRGVNAEDGSNGFHDSAALGAEARLPFPRLSRREAQVLKLLALGMTTPQIAESLSVTRITARNHVSRVLTKLGVQTRLQAVVYASQHGLN